ncbi:MAG: 30S ribosomal protein S9 [Verrucomicrobiales bacterium]|nr:30S ribosomal protein S9 [Verrucomicrobiales bacterium]MCP5558428.1 30S ribosomal protein S9 [Verrucomicrobiaceae bacterium]
MSTPKSSATGRRKTAVARVLLREGNGQITVNGRSFEEYFPTLTLQNQVLFPLQLTNTHQTFDVSVNTNGGGVTGQVGAVRLGVARALIAVDAELRPVLKKAGLLTRDSRAKERKKAGRPGARKRFQFSKR